MIIHVAIGLLKNLSDIQRAKKILKRLHLLKINMASENRPHEKEIPITNHRF